MKRRLLVIGYGNELRHDDAVGPCVARAVSQWELPGIAAVAVQQLTPELAEMIADADTVIFVDADKDAGETVRCRSLKPVHRASSLGHVGDPRELLALTDSLYQHRPKSWLITVPAPDLSYGEGLSAVAKQGLAQALEVVRRFHLVPESNE